jgi:hypothetical protein
MVSLVCLKNLPENVGSRRKYVGNITSDRRNFVPRTIVMQYNICKSMVINGTVQVEGV